MRAEKAAETAAEKAAESAAEKAAEEAAEAERVRKQVAKATRLGQQQHLIAQIGILIGCVAAMLLLLLSVWWCNRVAEPLHGEESIGMLGLDGQESSQCDGSWSRVAPGLTTSNWCPCVGSRSRVAPGLETSNGCTSAASKQESRKAQKKSSACACSSTTTSCTSISSTPSSTSEPAPGLAPPVLPGPSMACLLALPCETKELRSLESR